MGQVYHSSPSSPCSTDLLGLLEGPMVTSTTAVMAPHLTSDISLLDPTPSSTLPEVREQQGSLALTLFENPIGSMQVPGEYAHYPVVSGWDKKVGGTHTHTDTHTHTAAHTHMHTITCTHTVAHTHTHMHAHTHTLRHTHAHTRERGKLGMDSCFRNPHCYHPISLPL